MKIYNESHSRSIFKALSWRLTGTFWTVALVFIFTKKVGLALTLGGIETVSKIFLYFFHERLWDKIRYGKRGIEPVVLWFTGLSGSGKSTLAKKIYEKLKKDFKVEYLDGDVIRSLFPQTGFTQEERDTHIKRVGYLAHRLSCNGVFVVASFISPYRESRQFVRNLCDHFVEIYVSTPLEVCEKRDSKGLYAKARGGRIKNFTGIDDPYEAPLHPELEVNTANCSVDEAVSVIMKYLRGKVFAYGPIGSARKQKHPSLERGLQPIQESGDALVNR